MRGRGDGGREKIGKAKQEGDEQIEINRNQNYIVHRDEQHRRRRQNKRAI